MKILSLPTTGIQRAESAKVIKARVLVVHLFSLGVLFVPYTHELLIATVVSYFIRVFAWEGASHRYFAHRTYETSRAFQLFLAILAAAAGVRGPLWWVTHHRLHHRTSDTVDDLHSPIYYGFWYAHMNWFFNQRNSETDLDAAKEFVRFPELVLVNKYHYVFLPILMIAIYLAGEYTALFGRTGLGWSAVFWVFFLGTMLALQSLFTINSFVHGIKPSIFNHRRFGTDDTTTNCWPMAILTMGASWHNNHHRYAGSAKVGFYWWQIDLTYCVLRLLALLGLIWNLRLVPEAVREEGRRPVPQTITTTP